MLTPAERKKKMGAVIRAGSGNFLELYDFLVYAYFANYIALAFFPAGNELTRRWRGPSVRSFSAPTWTGTGAAKACFFRLA